MEKIKYFTFHLTIGFKKIMLTKHHNNNTRSFLKDRKIESEEKRARENKETIMETVFLMPQAFKHFHYVYWGYYRLINVMTYKHHLCLSFELIKGYGI